VARSTRRRLCLVCNQRGASGSRLSRDRALPSGSIQIGPATQPAIGAYSNREEEDEHDATEIQKKSQSPQRGSLSSRRSCNYDCSSPGGGRAARRDSIFLNSANRVDSTATVLAQNELNQFTNQTLATLSYTDNIGNVALSETPYQRMVGSPVITSNDNRQVTIFSGTVNGYNFTWADPTILPVTL